jgi:hypothetical protein
MALVAAIKTLIPCSRTFAPYVKALAFLPVLLPALTQQSFAADCSRAVDTLARLRCFDRAADSRLPRPKGAKLVEPEDRDKRIRKFGGQLTK